MRRTPTDSTAKANKPASTAGVRSVWRPCASSNATPAPASRLLVQAIIVADVPSSAMKRPSPSDGSLSVSGQRCRCGAKARAASGDSVR